MWESCSQEQSTCQEWREDGVNCWHHLPFPWVPFFTFNSVLCHNGMRPRSQHNAYCFHAVRTVLSTTQPPGHTDCLDPTIRMSGLFKSLFPYWESLTQSCFKPFIFSLRTGRHCVDILDFVLQAGRTHCRNLMSLFSVYDICQSEREV